MGIRSLRSRPCIYDVSLYGGTVCGLGFPFDNTIEVQVTNLWANRMIGDEQHPDDIVWSDALHYEYAPGNPAIGRYMMEVPDWLRHGQPRPSQGRKSVYVFKFFEKYSPLLPSGLMGPVEVKVLR